jgi:hypothetical protein
MDDEFDAPQPATVAVTIRVARPGGTIEEITWGDGELVTSHLDGGGRSLRRRAVSVRPDGTVEVQDDGDEATPPGSFPVEVSTNVYGASIERTDLGEGIVVEKTLDDDGRLTCVRMRGPGGEEELTLLADGGRARSWRFAVHGRQTWDASNRCTEDRVVFR